MQFSEFAQNTYSVFGGNESIGNFTKTLFSAITDDSSVLDTYGEQTYKSYYYGNSKITLISKKISPFVDPDLFGDFINRLSDSVKERLSVVFDIGDTEEVGKFLGDMFGSIIYDAGKGRTGSKKYYENISRYLSELKVLVCPYSVVKFYDYFVCSNIASLGGRRQVISGATSEILAGKSKHMILTGAGGTGKTMMMRHLFFTTDPKNHFPVYVELRNYSGGSLKSYITEYIRSYNDGLVSDDLEYNLIKGKCVLLLDGMDEVSGQYIKTLESEIEKFTYIYDNNFIVITSRLTSNFMSLSRYDVYEILPLTIDQAVELIEKLPYDRNTKEMFTTDLKSRLYYSHRKFAENPLLLTIMLLTYDKYGSIPEKMHAFYDYAYETMAHLHDATKGTFLRQSSTGLLQNEFKKLFCAFCAVSYYDEKYEFSESDFAYYTDIAAKFMRTEVDPQKFAKDLMENLCIMYKENGRYRFIHRSFQEYFVALRIASFSGKDMENACKFFNVGEDKTNMAFPMLYDMKSYAVDTWVLTPFLSAMFVKYDGYWDFVKDVYPHIYVEEGDIESGYPYKYKPKKYYYTFIQNMLGLDTERGMENLLWPSEISYLDKEDWVMKKETDEWGETSRTLCRKSDLPDNYPIKNPKIRGTLWHIDTAYLAANKGAFPDTVRFMESPDFPLYIEYTKMQEYLKKISDMKKTKSSCPWLYIA